MLVQLIWNHVEAHDLGIVLGADGALRLFPGLVRIPDASFVAWERLPGRKLPDDPIPELVPDLAIEVMSVSNTPAEMQRKVRRIDALERRVEALERKVDQLSKSSSSTRKTTAKRSTAAKAKPKPKAS